MTENEDLLAKIGQLAGQINRHKSQSTQPHQPSSHQSQYVSRHTHSHPGWAPYSRGSGRGRHVAPHRNRTLVLNNGTSGASNSNTSSPGPLSDNDSEARQSTPSSGWVAKRDRHMQLINSAVYDKEKQARARAMEETRKVKALRRAEREQTKVLRYAQAAGVGASVSTTAQPAAAHQILVNDVPFKITHGGSKLVRNSSTRRLALFTHTGIGLPVLDDPNTANTTPKRVTVAGVTFVRSKNGNLHRLGAVASKKCVVVLVNARSYADSCHRNPSVVKKRDELCKRFTTTGILCSDGLRPAPPSLPGMRILTQTHLLGTCYKGPSCPFIHDPTKVAICKDFLQTGQCSAGMSCDLSHEPSPHRSPFCMHFLRGRCSNPDCRYAHIRVTPGAPVCRAFATLGYCEKGASCEERHVHECPDYANNGVCHKKRCKLPHVDRAGQIRKAAAAAAAKAGALAEHEDESDQSSEEEDYDAIDSDDVDSDEFDDVPEELIAGMDSGEMSQQQDFIQL
ncbi:uncharacterized protein N7482_008893 [Penicillium canariense]|uniref:C3H1-type domain-containing protein n=1 Tax=Penicillium canariense TaxID=189055 RepID=A0A9W9HU66_9EURO|nr:uncharacterized protein N7482_008893 [Penicillium canariense]KAJ5157793.1 hypothetical protein N7482_008893 [Penicillium canariense]